MVITPTFACTGCRATSGFFVGLSFYVGCVGMMHYQFGCYTNAMKVVWGMPRFHTKDFFSLSLLLLWPLSFVQLVRDKHEPSFVVFATLMLVACFVFLWFRGLWLLQSNGINGFAKRCCFFGLVIPLTMINGLLWGIAGVVTLVTLGMGIYVAVVAVAVSLPLMMATNWCLIYTFGWTRTTLSSESPQPATNFPIWLQYDTGAQRSMDVLSRR